MYCSGWARRGPSGIIGTNITDARSAVAAIVEDVRSETNTPALLYTVVVYCNRVALHAFCRGQPTVHSIVGAHRVIVRHNRSKRDTRSI